ncbi:mitochondrial glyco protein [Tothia fuscella]|uniref:Mitochondrial glyco protein n=1 Tax=Tothia fuscella TaxID=1048955 RepID=A0A9P4NZ31_9PEZI|nr:mitochondrial glyco protein [Tothia fuscella]
MFSRLARSAPRTLNHQLSSKSQRFVSRSPAAFSLRSQPIVARYGVSFSTTSSRKQGNEELVAKLESEYNIERDIKNENEYNLTIKEYIDNSPFEIHDTPGEEEVVLTRKYNDENIRVTFSIADLANSDANQDSIEEDRAMFNDEDSDDINAQSGGANTKGSQVTGRTSGGNFKQAPEDSVSPADRPELDDEDGESSQGPAYPARVNVKVTRENQNGAMLIEAVAQDGEIIIDNVYYFADAAHADPETSQEDWKRRAVYAGPPFGNLDEDLQILLERYLEERGVNVKLAQFVPDYIDHKEQKEYLRWLSNLKQFFE